MIFQFRKFYLQYFSSQLLICFIFNFRTKKFETGFKKTQWVFYLQ